MKTRNLSNEDKVQIALGIKFQCYICKHVLPIEKNYWYWAFEAYGDPLSIYCKLCGRAEAYIEY